MHNGAIVAACLSRASRRCGAALTSRPHELESKVSFIAFD